MGCRGGSGREGRRREGGRAGREAVSQARPTLSDSPRPRRRLIPCHRGHPCPGLVGGGRGMAGRASRCHLSTPELVQASFSQCPDTNIDTRAVYIWNGCWVRQAVGRPQAGTPWEEVDPNGRIQCHGVTHSE